MLCSQQQSGVLLNDINYRDISDYPLTALLQFFSFQGSTKDPGVYADKLSISLAINLMAPGNLHTKSKMATAVGIVICS
jgi:hypothetical protein